MKALIQNNKIIQVSQESFPVHTSLSWVDCPADCTTHWIYKDGECAAPVVSLEDKKAGKLAALKAHYDVIMSDPHCDTGLGFQVDSGYPNLVDFREGLAMDWLTIRAYDNTNHTVTAQEMQQIIDKIVAWGFALKQCKWALEDEIKAATDDTIDTIDITTGWPV